MKCSPFLTWEEAYMHPTEEVTVKKLLAMCILVCHISVHWYRSKAT